MNHPLGPHGSHGSILYAIVEGSENFEAAWAQLLEEGTEVLRTAGGVYGTFMYGSAGKNAVHADDKQDTSWEALAPYNKIMSSLEAKLSDEANNEIFWVPDEKLGDTMTITLFVTKQDLSE